MAESVKLDLSSESEKITFFELLQKLKNGKYYPTAIQFENGTYEIEVYKDGIDYEEQHYDCEYYNLLVHISESLTFSELLTKKAFTMKWETK